MKNSRLGFTSSVFSAAVTIAAFSSFPSIANAEQIVAIGVAERGAPCLIIRTQKGAIYSLKGARSGALIGKRIQVTGMPLRFSN
ncbi:MAG: hypothetical protein AB8B49_06640, partial [Nitratireductor sp.]